MNAMSHSPLGENRRPGDSLHQKVSEMWAKL